MKPTVNVAFSSERVWTFLTLVGQRKSHGKKGRRALWLHMKEKKYVAAIVKEIICHISPHFTAKKKKRKEEKTREAQSRRRSDVEVWRDLDGVGCCQASRGLSAPSLSDSLTGFCPVRQAGRLGRLKKKERTVIVGCWQFFIHGVRSRTETDSHTAALSWTRSHVVSNSKDVNTPAWSHTHTW